MKTNRPPSRTELHIQFAADKAELERRIREARAHAEQQMRARAQLIEHVQDSCMTLYNLLSQMESLQREAVRTETRLVFEALHGRLVDVRTRLLTAKAATVQ